MTDKMSCFESYLLFSASDRDRLRRWRQFLIFRGGLSTLSQMQIAPVFGRSFGKLYGKPCWGVRPGHGSFLTLEFGNPRLRVRERIVASSSASANVKAALARRIVTARGDWHLWIYCCDWTVLFKGKRIGDSSATRKIRRAADFLNGQKLVRFSMSPRYLTCAFEFDLGATLNTRPFDKKLEQWLLYEPSQKVLVLRADGRYKHQWSNQPGNLGQWKPVRISVS